ncbi:unnamed protein product [Dibothriocephalus latus]|uniref:carbonic anhydrase n=1 Tax=Dibothriocephalus latus TaxID=60516 RepID=A0A3P6TJZ2_DIBLA|nr:unnamed protein product [Dibothriocephalus latus]
MGKLRTNLVKKFTRAFNSATSIIVLDRNTFQLKGIELQALIPPIDEYMTYEGSLPFPSCAETITWIILNMAIQVSEREVRMQLKRRCFHFFQLKTLRQLRVEKTLWSASMADNFRPVNALNNRSVRTNINFFLKQNVLLANLSVNQMRNNLFKCESANIFAAAYFYTKPSLVTPN